MHFEHLYLSLLPLAFASPTPSDIKVVYRYDRVADDHGIAAFDTAGLLIGYSCDSTLVSGSFDKTPISFDIDENADGYITISGKAYPIHTDAKYSGGPTCTRIYNKKMAELDCSVSMPQSFEGTAVPANQIHDCFGVEWSAYDLAKGVRRLDTSLATLEVRHPDIEDNKYLNYTDGSLDKRCLITHETVGVGNGNPHQNHFEQQVTGNIDCEEAAICSASSTESVAYTWTTQAGFTVYQWISFGFAVGQSFTQSETYTCGGTTGQTICVWYSSGYTAYTVQNEIKSTCDGQGGTGGVQKVGNPGVIESPNSGGVNSGYYCVVGTCRGLNQGYWNYKGRPGGP